MFGLSWPTSQPTGQQHQPTLGLGIRGTDCVAVVDIDSALLAVAFTCGANSKEELHAFSQEAQQAKDIRVEP